MKKTLAFDETGLHYQQAHIAHWDAVARKRDTWSGWGGIYHHRLEEVYRFLVSPGQSIDVIHSQASMQSNA